MQSAYARRSGQWEVMYCHITWRLGEGDDKSRGLGPEQHCTGDKKEWNVNTTREPDITVKSTGRSADGE